jgi:glycerophosphoryl diester phosphodiesterase
MARISADIEIIAHRGAGAGRVQPDTPPENTLPALEYAWSAGADAAEVDVHLTRDGRLVAIHDDTTDRTSDARLVVAKHTLEELQRLDAGSWKQPCFARIRLPSIEEVIETVPAGRRLYIELKTAPAIVAPLAKVLCGRDPEQFPIISFFWDTIVEAKRSLAGHECLLVTETVNAGLAKRVRDAGLDGMDVEYPSAAHMVGTGLQCVVWTVDDVEAVRALIALGISRITTNVPARLRQALS